MQSRGKVELGEITKSVWTALKRMRKERVPGIVEVHMECYLQREKF